MVGKVESRKAYSAILRVSRKAIVSSQVLTDVLSQLELPFCKHSHEEKSIWIVQTMI